MLDWLEQGNRLREDGKPAEALEAYRRAVHLAPTDVSLRFNVALALLDLHRPEEALVWARQAAAAEHVYPPVLTSMGEALLRMGRHEDARRFIAKGLEMPDMEKDDPEIKQRGRETLAKLR